VPVEKLTIHVGYPKCGSTSLQEAFAATGSALYLKEARQTYLHPDIHEFVREVAPVADVRMCDQNRFRDAFARIFAETEYDHALLSAEILSSVGFAPLGGGLSLPQILENFRRVVDCPIEVVIVLREQFAFLRSYYRQLVWHDLSFNEFASLVLMRRNRWLYPALDYDRVVRTIAPQVDRVHVFAFESLFFDRSKDAAMLEAIGVGDVIERFRATHKRSTKDRPDAQTMLSLNRRGIAAGARPAGPWIPGGDEMRHLRREDPRFAPYARHLDDLKRRVVLSRNLQRDLAKAPTVPVAEDAMALHPDLRALLAGHVAEANTRLAQTRPETDWRGLGYLMEDG